GGDRVPRQPERRHGDGPDARHRRRVDRMVDQGSGVGRRGPETASSPPATRPPTLIPWRLAPGVSLLQGTLAGGEPAGAHVYALVLPSGRRFQVSEPLFRLAELLQGQLPPEEIAARLSARLG